MATKKAVAILAFLLLGTFSEIASANLPCIIKVSHAIHEVKTNVQYSRRTLSEIAQKIRTNGFGPYEAIQVEIVVLIHHLRTIDRDFLKLFEGNIDEWYGIDVNVLRELKDALEANPNGFDAYLQVEQNDSGIGRRFSVDSKSLVNTSHFENVIKDVVLPGGVQRLDPVNGKEVMAITDNANVISPTWVVREHFNVNVEPQANYYVNSRVGPQLKGMVGVFAMKFENMSQETKYWVVEGEILGAMNNAWDRGPLIVEVRNRPGEVGNQLSKRLAVPRESLRVIRLQQQEPPGDAQMTAVDAKNAESMKSFLEAAKGGAKRAFMVDFEYTKKIIVGTSAVRRYLDGNPPRVEIVTDTGRVTVFANQVLGYSKAEIHDQGKLEEE